MGLQIDPDDLPAGRKQLDVRAEHLDRSETAVQQDQRKTSPENLIAELDAIHARHSGCAG